jgi:hypothetical protein
LLETAASARRLQQIEPLGAGQCRLGGRAYTDHADGSGAFAWPKLVETAALAASTQIGLTAASFRAEVNEAPALLAFRVWYDAAFGGN